MKLIIDIPKSIYDKICLKMMHTEIDNPNLYFERLISNGTPIPYNATVCDIEKIRAEITELFKAIGASNSILCFAVLQLIDNYAEQEPKVTTTSTDEPMVMQYPQVDGITPTVVKAEQAQSRDIKEIAEIMKCDADAETKCKMISNILTAKPHYFAEQEPCDDVVSRQAVLDLIKHYNSDGLGSVFYGYEQGVKFADAVNKLPSVRPQEQTGHWETSVDRWGEVVATVNGYRCSECGEFNGYNDKYCPNCGCRMVEPQESEEEREGAYDKCPICVNRNKSCQFGTFECHFIEQIEESEDKHAKL